MGSRRLMKRWTGNEALGRSRLSHWIQFESNMHTLECDNPAALDSSELVYCSCNDFFSGVIADDASVDSFFEGSTSFTERLQQARAACDDSALFSCDAVAFEIAAEYEWFLTNQGNQTDTSSSFVQMLWHLLLNRQITLLVLWNCMIFLGHTLKLKVI